MPHGGGTRGDAYRLAVAAHKIRETPQRQVEARDAVGGGCLQEPAGLGGHHATRMPLHQAGTDLALQPLHVLAHRGLGARQLPGDSTQAADATHGNEHAQIIEGHEDGS